MILLPQHLPPLPLLNYTFSFALPPHIQPFGQKGTQPIVAIRQIKSFFPRTINLIFRKNRFFYFFELATRQLLHLAPNSFIPQCEILGSGINQMLPKLSCGTPTPQTSRLLKYDNPMTRLCQFPGTHESADSRSNYCNLHTLFLPSPRRSTSPAFSPTPFAL